MKSKLFFLSLILLVSSGVSAQYSCPENFNHKKDDPRDYPFEVAYHYHQEKLEYDDPFADYILIKSLEKHTTDKIVSYLGSEKKKKAINIHQIKRDEDYKRTAYECFNLKPKEVPVYQDKAYTYDYRSDERISRDEDDIILHGKKSPINVRQTIKMFRAVIAQEASANPNCKPHLGKVHKWSKGVNKFLNPKQKAMKLLLPKVLVALSNGETSKYMVTGNEAKLEQWVLAQAPRSITLDMIFRKSFQVNCGDLYLTLLTIENVLSQYFYYPSRERLELTNKLSPITNHYGDYGQDTYGSWYHFFGMMLYGHIKGAIPAKILGSFESVNGFLKGESSEMQEFYMVKGGRIGAALGRFIKKEKYNNYSYDAEKVFKRDNYLMLDEDFEKRLKD